MRVFFFGGGGRCVVLRGVACCVGLHSAECVCLTGCGQGHVAEAKAATQSVAHARQSAPRSTMRSRPARSLTMPCRCAAVCSLMSGCPVTLLPCCGRCAANTPSFSASRDCVRVFVCVDVHVHVYVCGCACIEGSRARPARARRAVIAANMSKDWCFRVCRVAHKATLTCVMVRTSCPTCSSTSSLACSDSLPVKV